MKTNASRDHYCASYRSLENYTIQTDDLFMSFCGIEQCRPDKSYGPIARPEWHVHFVRKGKGFVEIKGHKYQVQGDQIFALPPDIAVYYYADRKDPWEYAWISLNGNKASHYLKQAGLTPSNIIRDTYLPANQYFELIDKILDANELTLANDLRRTGYCFDILATMIETQNGASHPGKSSHDYNSDVYVEHALQFIRYNYSHIKVSDIAGFIGINRSYLTSIFKQKLNVSPQEYLVSYRMDKAERLIRTTGLSIGEIADKVGYSDPLAFSKMFKASYGLSPKNYRNKYQ